MGPAFPSRNLLVFSRVIEQVLATKETHRRTRRSCKLYATERLFPSFKGILSHISHDPGSVKGLEGLAPGLWCFKKWWKPTRDIGLYVVGAMQRAVDTLAYEITNITTRKGA